MRQALLINRYNARSLPIDIQDISELDKEDFFSSGLALFFDKDNELVIWACSYEDVLSISKDIVTEDIYGYHIIKDLDKPYTDVEIDMMYDGLCNDAISIILTNRPEKIEVRLCLN